MNTITVSHRGRPVALVAPRRFWLAAHINALPDGHPRKRFVAFMVLYARDVLTGELTGPYSDEDAERFARLALMDQHVTVPSAPGRSIAARGGSAIGCVPYPSSTSAFARRRISPHAEASVSEDGGMSSVIFVVAGLAVFGVFVALAYRRQWQWTGLPAPRPDNRRAKTLWDWLQLLVIPVQP